MTCVLHSCPGHVAANRHNPPILAAKCQQPSIVRLPCCSIYQLFQVCMQCVTTVPSLIPELQVYNNMLGDMDFFSDPASALANAVVKTNDQLHRAVQIWHPVHCRMPSILFIALFSLSRKHT